MSWKRTLLICTAVLVIGAAVTALIFSTEPTAKRTGAVRETAMLVDVSEVHRGAFRPTITATGIVEPSQDIVLSPLVAGEIIRRAPGFTPGGYVKKGEVLLQIDPANYQNILAQRRSELHRATAELEIEMGRQNVAKQDYELLDDSLSNEHKALVLREPQLNAAKSLVESARAAVEQAELDLKRTTLTAPFDAHILIRNVDVGSQVAPGDDLGRLVGLETYWVVVTVPLSKLRWLDIQNDGETGGSKVKIRNRTAWDEGEYREGRLYRLVGALENETRMARVLVTVPDPHGRRAVGSDVPALIIGAFVEASIEGKELSDIARINRDYIRSDDTVWVMEDGKLRIRDVDIVLRDAKYAYIRNGLNKGDLIVTTNLATVSDGAPLRVR